MNTISKGYIRKHGDIKIFNFFELVKVTKLYSVV